MRPYFIGEELLMWIKKHPWQTAIMIVFFVWFFFCLRLFTIVYGL